MKAFAECYILTADWWIGQILRAISFWGVKIGKVGAPEAKIPVAALRVYVAGVVLSRSNRCRSIFPVPVLGSVSQNSISSGTM